MRTLNEVMISTQKKEIIQLQNLVSQLLKHQINLSLFDEDEDFIDDDSEDDDEEENMDKNDVQQKKKGRPKKTFNQSGKNAKKRKTDDILAELRQTASELGITFQQLILYLGKRDADSNGDDNLSKLFQELNRNGKNGQPKMSPLKALAMKKKLIMVSIPFDRSVNFFCNSLFLLFLILCPLMLQINLPTLMFF